MLAFQTSKHHYTFQEKKGQIEWVKFKVVHKNLCEYYMIAGVLWGNCWIIYSFIVYVLRYILNGKLWINL
jgi:hypothetical protein